MMICKADFEELFPEIFAPEPNNGLKASVQQPNARRSVRWEDDDGGRLDTLLAPCEMSRPHAPLVA